MVEKKSIVEELMLTYSGPLSVEEFYAEVEKWMGERGLQKEVKRKSETVTQNGRKIEWVIEAWKAPIRSVKSLVKLRVLFNNVKEVKIKRKDRSVTVNNGDVLINIDGWLETSLTNRYTQRPFYTFFRTLYDKYVWVIGQNVTEMHEAGVKEDSYDLHRRLKSFFELYRMKLGR